MEEENQEQMEEENQEQEQKRERRVGEDDNNIFVGAKPLMNYVTGVVMQFNTKGAEEVVIKARGKFISKAVDIAEAASKRFLKGEVELGDIKIDSEEFTSREGRNVRVSIIEITLLKK